MDRKCPNLEVKCENYKWLVDPLVGLPTGNYDLILDKDWLERHASWLDCREGTVKFWPPGGHPMRVKFDIKNDGVLPVLTVVETLDEGESEELEESQGLAQEGVESEEPDETFFGADNEEKWQGDKLEDSLLQNLDKIYGEGPTNRNTYFSILYRRMSLSWVISEGGRS